MYLFRLKYNSDIRNLPFVYKKIGNNELTVIRNRFYQLSPGRNI